jgi:hypothetical protein
MGFVIGLANSISGLPSSYQQAITTAINFFETTITTNITVNLAFDWSSLGAGGPVADSFSSYLGYTYSRVYQAIQNVDGSLAASSVQRAAADTLKANFPVDPTKGGQFWITTADARALGLNTSLAATDSTITLNSSDSFTWSQSGGIAAGTYDAVGVIEHEISEALGRTAFLGQSETNLINGSGGKLPTYNILDMFHYAAASNASNASPGSAAGALDEPFVAGYNASVQGYFSYNGSTVTLPFGSPSEIAAGDDVADWKSTVHGDSFGFASTGVEGVVSTPDLETLNVLGYSEASCFCAGTRIGTAWGEGAVETLQRGDLVMTHDGRAMPVSWIGVQTVSRRFADPLRVLPVRVKASALGDNVPCRDLRLSPDHALYIGGAMIQAGALVNGTSIIRDSETPAVFVYYHIELDDHSLIMAENAPAETFMDNVDRMNFDNWQEHTALYPGGRDIAELSYPRAKAARQVPQHIRAEIAARAAILELGRAVA